MQSVRVSMNNSCSCEASSPLFVVKSEIANGFWQSSAGICIPVNQFNMVFRSDQTLASFEQTFVGREEIVFSVFAVSTIA